MGAVARDHHGDVLATMACQGKDVVVAELVEAHSVRHALRWANELNLGKIIIETDCASIVTALLSDIALNSELGNILSDCKSMMASFPYCHVQHTRRTGNAVAHELAKRALQAEGNEFFISEIPVFLAPFVARDKLPI
ncbi:hypothetical protein SLE2022_374300 [Rubroshorea leprosula]